MPAPTAGQRAWVRVRRSVIRLRAGPDEFSARSDLLPVGWFRVWRLGHRQRVSHSLRIGDLLPDYAVCIHHPRDVGAADVLALASRWGGTSNGANLLPSVSVLLFPLLARSSPVVQLFTGTTSTVDGGAGYVLAIGGLLLIAAIAIRIAVRRYQAVGAVGISPALGLMFLAVWAVLAAADCAMPDVFNFDRYLRYSGEELTAQIVCALSSTMLIALLPIAGAALMVQRRQTTWAANFWVPLASMIVVCCVLAGVRGDNLPRSKVPSAVVQSCIVIAAFALTTTCFFSAGYRHRRRAWVYVLFWITITWLTPGDRRCRASQRQWRY